uniref:Uncharacterized protein n=1 Tax=Branchiostoma floridae TaxID=7739 RepID=C3YGT2_BRAFL|eukprot:XP_002604392.1 hypothetical protein BRAFLDRAFT_79305 [Branchiostoma floridae]
MLLQSRVLVQCPEVVFWPCSEQTRPDKKKTVACETILGETHRSSESCLDPVREICSVFAPGLPDLPARCGQQTVSSWVRTSAGQAYHQWDGADKIAGKLSASLGAEKTPAGAGEAHEASAVWTDEASADDSSLDGRQRPGENIASQAGVVDWTFRLLFKHAVISY